MDSGSTAVVRSSWLRLSVWRRTTDVTSESIPALAAEMDSTYGVRSDTLARRRARTASSWARAMSVVRAPGQARCNISSTDLAPMVKLMLVHERPITTVALRASSGVTIFFAHSSTSEAQFLKVSSLISKVDGSASSLRIRSSTPGKALTSAGASRCRTLSVGTWTQHRITLRSDGNAGRNTFGVKVASKVKPSDGWGWESERENLKARAEATSEELETWQLDKLMEVGKLVTPGGKVAFRSLQNREDFSPGTAMAALAHLSGGRWASDAVGAGKTCGQEATRVHEFYTVWGVASALKLNTTGSPKSLPRLFGVIQANMLFV
ncbi:hypothetical protein T484DRAFT_3528394 [Baffinella frigidus]|nr:hypothetical protein T484DRAFT_3528394 [Cryptophyta sp. CCMP2293]